MRTVYRRAFRLTEDQRSSVLNATCLQMHTPQTPERSSHFFRAIMVTGGIKSLCSSLFVVVFCANGQGYGDDPADVYAPEKQSIECEILIIGSGFAGTYSAYQLAPEFGRRLCIVEALDRDGGRFLDLSETEGGPVFGAGPLRVTETQTGMLELADVLGIELERAESDVDLYRVRGRRYLEDFASGNVDFTRMCLESFPTLNCTVDPIQNLDASDVIFNVIYDLTQSEEGISVINSYPDIPTLITGLFDDETLAYLRETFPFTGDLFPSVSTSSLLDSYNGEPGEMKNYPVGGMTQFIIRMMRRVVSNGARIWRNEPVSDITGLSNGKFRVETRSLIFSADRVLCSIDPYGFQNVEGNVAESVKSAPEFQAIFPVPVATVQVWWNERWWERSRYNVNNITRVVSHGNCFNKMEIPPVDYIRNQNATRVVYDDGLCLDMWSRLISNESNAEALETVMVDGLQQVFDDVEIPRPRTIKGHIYKNCWHFLRGGTTLRNSDVFEWSHHPTPFENFALVGEAYNIDHSGWSNAARLSVNSVLERFYGFDRFPEDGERRKKAARAKRFLAARYR